MVISPPQVFSIVALLVPVCFAVLCCCAGKSNCSLILHGYGVQDSASGVSASVMRAGVMMPWFRCVMVVSVLIGIVPC